MHEAFIGEIPEGYIIHHIDFTTDNLLNNFKMMTNEDHKKLHNKGENHPMFGKHHSEETKKLISENHSDTKCENHPRSILTEQKVIKIRIDLDEGILTQKEIGKKFGVKHNAISMIKLGKTWNHIEI